MLLHEGDAAKEVAEQCEQRRPGDAAEDVEDHEVAPVHATHTRDEGHEGADEGEEAPEEDGEVAPLVEEGLGLGQALGGHGLDLAGRDDLFAKEVADHEVALVAEDGGAPRDREQRKDVEAAVMGKEARGEEQRVAGEEREEHHARLDEDDQEHAAVGHERAGGDPGSNCAAGVVEQLCDEVDEAHAGESPFWTMVKKPLVTSLPRGTGHGAAKLQRSALDGNGCPSEAPYGCCLPALTRFEV